MKAMILAAGIGERMRPLTDYMPKPLLLCAGKPLIVYHIEKLVAAGITDIIINLAYLGEKIEAALGDGSAYGACIRYSPEDTPLNTGGGIVNALPLLGKETFLVVNGDVWTDYNFSQLHYKSVDLAYLVMVANPKHNPHGDFRLMENGRVLVGEVNTDDRSSGMELTFSGISLLHPEIFDLLPKNVFPLRKFLFEAMQLGRVFGQFYTGFWTDVGTPDRLEALEKKLSKKVIF